MAKCYWFLTRPHTRGVKCLVWNSGKLLLTRLSYGHKLWTIPGGGVHRNEAPEEAAKREVWEETGIAVNHLNKIGEYTQVKDFKNDTVHCFSGNAANSDIAIDPLEIAEAGWFDVDELPKERTKQVDAILAMHKS